MSTDPTASQGDVSRKLNDDEVKAEFLRRLNITDHLFARTPNPCCNTDPRRHLGYGQIPWTLPPVSEMREVLGIR